MLTVRLQRVGRKNDPSFRMVIIDSKRGVKSADYIEMVGSYNPRQKTVEVDGDRIKHWISVGAKPTDTVHNILINEKVIEGKKVNPLGKKTPIVKDKAESADEAVEDSPTEEAQASSDVEAETPTAEEEKEDEPKAEKEEEKPADEEKPAEDKTEEDKKEEA